MSKIEPEARLVPLEAVMGWANLREKLRDEKGWIYRGQRLSTWGLQSTLERSFDVGTRARAEHDLVYRYQQALSNYVPFGQMPMGHLDLLGSMQHHGAPTRLLDFTRSPYVAAYFAIEDVSPDDSCAIWAVNEGACRSMAEGRIEKQVLDWIYNSDDWESHLAVAPVGLLHPNQRQIAQQSLFLVQGTVYHSLADNIRHTFGSQIGEHVRCYPIPGTCRGELLHDLRLMNITRASLFPGLDGFAQSLKYALIEEDQEEKYKRHRRNELGLEDIG
jgi:hypothetical protein